MRITLSGRSLAFIIILSVAGGAVLGYNFKKLKINWLRKRREKFRRKFVETQIQLNKEIN